MVTAARKKMGTSARRSRGSAGFTLMELLIAGVMISLVMIAAFSLYSSGLRLFVQARTYDVTLIPEVAVEDLMRKINVANFAGINPANQLNLRVDYLNCNPATPDPAGPANTAADSWWHYRFQAGTLLGLCDAAQNTVLAAAGNPAGTVVVLNNLDTVTPMPAYPPGTGSGGSGFLFVNPSGAGAPNVVYVHVNSTNPLKELNTEVAWAAPKR